MVLLIRAFLLIPGLWAQTGLAGNSQQQICAEFAHQNALIFGNGLVSVCSSDMTLRELLAEISLNTGSVFHFPDSLISSKPLSASIQSRPLVEVIKAVLKEYSYMIISPDKGDAMRVLLLSTPKAETWTAKTSPRDREKKVQLPVQVVTENEMDLLDGPEVSEADETMSAVGTGAIASTAITGSSLSEYQLRNLLQDLSSQWPGARDEALDALVKIDDPRVTEAIIHAAVGISSGDVEFRAQALEQLWQRAADNRYADGTVVNALFLLAEDNDETIKALAGQAIQDIENQRVIDSAE